MSNTPWLSILMAYNNRPKLLRNTLESYLYYYGDRLDQFEIVVVDDSSDDPGELISLMQEFPFKWKTQYWDRKDKECRNPCLVYNEAAHMAEGEYLMLTNPENVHLGDILGDANRKVEIGKYLVYGCLTLSSDSDSFIDIKENLGAKIELVCRGGWYQHTAHYNRLLHFCSFISADDYKTIGGFSELYSDGAGYDDNDLIESIFDQGMTVEAFDEPYCAHQNHARSQWTMDHTANNYRVFIEKWGRSPVDIYPASVCGQDAVKVVGSKALVGYM